MAKTNDGGVWDQGPLRDGYAGSTFVKRTPNVKPAVKTIVVRDDWDDDDEEEEQEGDVETAKERSKGDGTVLGPATSLGLSGRLETEAEAQQGEDSSQVWEEANKRAPMPELIVAPASTSQSFPPPPPAALQPTLRILKRPSPNASGNNAGAFSSVSLSSSSSGPSSSTISGSGGSSPAPRGTLAEREAQYQEARNRIFGGKEKSGSSTNGNASSASMSGTSSSSGGAVVIRDPLGPTSEPDLGDKAYGSGRPAKCFGERRRGKK